MTFTLAGIALCACGTDSAHPAGPTPIPTPVPTAPSGSRLVEIWVEGGYPQKRLTLDSLEQNSSTGRITRGRAADGTVADVAAAWTSSDTAVVKLAGTSSPTTMSVVSRALGTVTITVHLGTLSAAYTMVVTPLRLRQVLVHHAPTPTMSIRQPDSIVVRSTSQYVAECTTGGSDVIPGRPITWRTSDTTRATVDSAGRVLAHALGLVRLTASCTGVMGEVVEGGVQLFVRPPRAARIAFTYVPDSLMVTRFDSVRAVLYDSAGKPTAIPVRFAVPAWATTFDDLVDGKLYAAMLGTVDVEASGDGLTVRHPLRVYPVPAAPPRAYPAALVLPPDTRALLAARAVNIDGITMSGAPAPTYASADPSVASVSDAGVVTAHGPGSTTVRLRIGGMQTDVPVTVVAPGAFQMEFRAASASPLSATLASALARAAQRWQTAILGDLPDVRLTLSKDVCGLTSPPTEELTIDDMLVFASADSIDGPGGVLAQAGPCVIRNDGTTIVGHIQVDSADVARLAASGQLVTVLQHELGHVLGIGTLWTRPSLNFVAPAGTDWGYRGPRGLSVGTWWGRLNPAGVWLGEAKGSGKGHWNESMFDNELMTPVLNAGANPLSLLTLEALADLGYATSAAAADSYALYPGTSGAGPAASRAGRGGGPAAARASFDRVLQPRWRVAGSGRLERMPR